VQGSAGAKKLRKAYFFPAANAFGVAHPKTDFVAVEPAALVCVGCDLAVDAGSELQLKKAHGLRLHNVSKRVVGRAVFVRSATTSRCGRAAERVAVVACAGC
jgi:hypothetical protein